MPSLKILYFNGNSIKGKLNEIKVYTHTYQADILCIAETKIDHTFDDNELLGPSFTVYRNDRKEGGGGVLVAIRSGIECLDILENRTGPGESLALILRLKQTFNMILFYRPPSEYHLENFTQLIEAPVSIHPSILVGDFNLPGIDWATTSQLGQVKQTCHCKSFSQQALDTINANNLCQLIHEPTHARGNTLDLVLIDRVLLDDFDIVATVLPRLSDHNMILVDMTMQNTLASKEDTHSKVKYNFKKAKYPNINDAFKLLLQRMKNIRQGNIEQVWIIFKECIDNALTDFVPKLLERPRGKPWMTRELLRLVRQRDRAYRNNLDSTTQLELTKSVKRKIFQAKSNYIEDHLSSEILKGNTKPIYNYVRQPRGQAIQMNTLRGVEKPDIPDALADYFASVFVPGANMLENPASPTIQLVDPPIVIDPVGLDKLLRGLMEFRHIQ